MNKEQFIEAIKGMTILELNDLVSALEEEFGVSAVAVATGGGAAGGAAEAAAEKTEFDVVLKDIGTEKVKVIKVVREQTGLGLAEAKDIAVNAPKTIKEGLSKEDALKVVEAFKAVGATAELV